MKKQVIAGAWALAGLLSISGCAAGASPEMTNTPATKETVAENAAEEQTTAPAATFVSNEEGQLDSQLQKKWVRDLRNILKPTLAKVPGIAEHLSEADRNQRLDALVADIEAGTITEALIEYRLQELVSDIGISHLTMDRSIAYESNRNVLPISGEWIEDDYRIFICGKEYEEMLGAKVISMNGVSMDDILAAYDRIIVNENENACKYTFENMVYMGMSCADMAYLGILDEGQTTCPVVFEDETATQKTLDISAVWLDDTTAKAYVDGLVSFTDNHELAYGARVYENSGYAPFVYELHPEKQMVYLQYNECRDSSCGNDFADYPLFSQFFDEMMQVISKQESLQTLIVDLRNNGGGNEMLWNDMMEKYADALAPMQIKLLVGKATFSAAVDCIDTTLEMFEHVTIYGEEPSQAIRTYTNSMAFELPETGVCFYLPRHEDAIRVLDQKYSDLTKGVLPDVPVQQTYEDLKKGIDTVYEKAVNA